jgi:PKHD-type hydroxylase
LSTLQNIYCIYASTGDLLQDQRNCVLFVISKRANFAQPHHKNPTMIAKYPLLTAGECDAIVADLDRLPWSGGLAPGQSYRDKVKRNKEIALQMSPDTAVADEHLRLITSKLLESKFLKERVFGKSLVNPRFNLYEGGAFYGKHADSAYMGGGQQQVRTDISATLFLSDPASYEGGELVLDYPSGATVSIKESKGILVFYPSGVMHQVTPVTSGRRIAYVAWIESHIQNPQMRDVLVEITALCEELNTTNLALSESHIRAINIKHNLFRMWWKNEG